MINKSIISVLFFFLFFNLCLHPLSITASIDNERKPYIVYMGELPERTITSLVDEHHNLLLEATGDEMLARDSKMHSYGKSFNGFVARLLPHEADKLSKKEGIVSVFPNTVQKVQTTRSWDFLGMPEATTKRNTKIESNLIIGLLDTGVYVQSSSFNDKGYKPPPPKWKGKCQKGLNFTGCNNKVIGAQYFHIDSGPNDTSSPADTEGHGTHTASTAAGISVKRASLYGLAKGTARGGVPSARIAEYKVCWEMGCQDMDLLAAFDAAIGDGVDIISISIGGPSRSYLTDPIAIGAFHAMKKGIITASAAGNNGPQLSSVQNVAPWIFTVAASSIDRRFETDVELGNGVKATGISINTYSPRKQLYPLTSGAQAAKAEYYGNASACDYGTLRASKVKGKIVYCVGPGGQDTTIHEYHGAGTILAVDDFSEEIPFAFLIPTTVIKAEDGKKIDHYINSTEMAKGVIYKSRTVLNVTAPSIAYFSARGPQLISTNILKPDIAAPGLNILAAFSPLTSVTGDPGDKRFAKFNIISGTSMATPHVASAAAYVKSFHPTWSPAAIKSALMTTATPMKIKPTEAELASGAGQINPTKALHPGLIYDLNPGTYIRFLCNEGYNSTAIRLLTGGKMLHNCSSLRPARGSDGLNYPSMQIQLTNPNKTNFSAVFFRTVTNVGYGKSEYKAKVQSPKGVSVTVNPKTLIFNKSNQKRSFRVAVAGKFDDQNSQVLSASLVWSDSMHIVKSPIVICRSFDQDN